MTGYPVKIKTLDSRHCVARMTTYLFLCAFLLLSISAIAQESSQPQGRQLFMAGNPRYQIPACASCHGPNGAGNMPAKIPHIAGLTPQYLTQQLKAYRNASRKTDPNEIMRDVALQLSDDDIAVLANYIARLY